MNDGDENLDWIRCPNCESILYYFDDGLFRHSLFFLLRDRGRITMERDFFCVSCCDFIELEKIAGPGFNSISVGGGDDYRTWRGKNNDKTIFAGKLKIIEHESDEWKKFLRALGIEPDTLGINLNINTSSPRRKDGKKVIYIDMDSVLVNFKHALIERGLNPDMDNADDIGGLFSEMVPLEGAVEAFKTLRSMNEFEVYILSTAPWNNPSAWYDKLQWVKRYLGEEAEKRLILSHHKDLNWGSFLIDDRPNNGAREFGEWKGQQWIHFGSDLFPDWQTILAFLQNEV